MNTLFPIETAYPDGFMYLPEFISPEEESFLLDEIQKIQLHSFIFQGYEAKRLVASFGFDWSFEKRSLSKGKDIPAAFYPLLEKVAVKLNFRKEDFGELLITKYPVGSVINWHRDAPPFDLIAGISLLAECKFRLRPHEKAKQVRGSIITVSVRRRSLYVMSGVARTEWQHSTMPVKQVRYSITLRTLHHT